MHKDRTIEWGNEPTVKLPAYRVMAMGDMDGPLIHITPTGSHIVDFDCEGVCLVCLHPLDAQS